MSEQERHETEIIFKKFRNCLLIIYMKWILTMRRWKLIKIKLEKLHNRIRENHILYILTNSEMECVNVDYNKQSRHCVADGALWVTFCLKKKIKFG